MSEAFYDRFGKKHYPDDGQAFPRRAAYAVVVREGKVLLTAKPRGDCWEFPGGGVDRGDDVRSCLYRELFEESGYDIELGRGEQEVRQTINFFADYIRPAGEFWHYDQIFCLYDGRQYGFELKEGIWNTPENGSARWTDLEVLRSGNIPINYCHKRAFEQFNF